MYKTTLKIDGMMCGMCEAHMNDTVRKIMNVKKVSSSHSKGETVIISEELPDEPALIKEIGKTGYKVISISSEPYEKKASAFLKNNADYWLRLQ